MSQVPSLFAPILHQSRMNPDAIAVVADTSTSTYAEFCSHIERVTRHLNALAIPMGSRVAVQVASQYFGWLLVISLSRLGLPSATAPARDMDCIAPDLVLTDAPEAWPGRSILAVTPDWIREPADHLPAFADRFHEGASHARLVLSSGTTGRPKVVVLTYEQLHRRNKQQIGDYGFTSASRLLITLGGIAGLMLPVNCWSAGGCVIVRAFAKGVSPARLLRTKPNIVMLSPSQLETILAGLGPDFVPVPDMRVYVAGSAMTRNLNMRARLRLTSSLFLCYGSTEIGTIALAPAAHADARPGFAGYVVPPVQVQIVDEAGRPVPNGTPGEIRIRAEGQAECYLDDPQATASCFREGWFHPGDLGAIGDRNDLRLVGRASEVMNFGGAKRAPEALEEVLRGVAHVLDIAVFSFMTPQGEKPGVAIVPAEGFSNEELMRRYAEAFPNLPAPSVFPVGTIPRNDMGKVMRAELAASLAAAPHGGAAPVKSALH